MKPKIKIYIWTTRFAGLYHYLFEIKRNNGNIETEVLVKNGMQFGVGKVEHTNEGIEFIIEFTKDLFPEFEYTWFIDDSEIAFDELSKLQ